MCSTEELKRSQDELKIALNLNTQAQTATQLELSAFISSCKTWRQTRCDDHHVRLGMVENGLQETRTEINKTIGKVAGVVATVTFLASLLALAIAYKTMGGPG